MTAVQEGRFRLLTIASGAAVSLFHKAALEPQDLSQLKATAVRVRVDCAASEHLIAQLVAYRIEIEE